MKASILKQSSIGAIVDENYLAAKSILLRYHRSCGSTLRHDQLKQASIREGVRLVHLVDYKGVHIHLLDETTGMASNTFESLIAAVSIAHCQRLGYTKAYFSSGGNLGEALTMYARKAGIKTFSFNPQVNVPFLDGNLFSAEDGHWLIGVGDAQKNRDFALRFGEKLSRVLGEAPIIPRFEWRTEALHYRALFILEYMSTHEFDFEVVAQTISAGFGPLGIFEVLMDDHYGLGLDRIPRFIGIQQESNSYMYQRWKNKCLPFSEPLIVPTLFDYNPDNSFGTFAAIERLLRQTKGDVITINQQEFDQHITRRITEKIGGCGIRHTRINGEFSAKSGLMALAGVLKAIDRGVISRGPVLVCMCDGIRPKTRPAQSSAVVNTEDDLDPLVQKFVELC